MSVEFDNKFIKFNRWNEQHRNLKRDINKDVEYLHAALDKMIELVECANKDLRAYEKGKSSLLII
jgi:hypothetical protein